MKDHGMGGRWEHYSRDVGLREGLAALYADERPARHTSMGGVGPAKRATRCGGEACWTPNRYGRCKMCGGDAPRRG